MTKLLIDVEVRKRPLFTDYTKEEFKSVTDGCGSISLRAKLPWLTFFIVAIECICRRHDFRYAIGWREAHRIKADILLGFEGMVYCLAMLIWYLFTGKFLNCFKLIVCFFLAPLFTLILLPVGWVTFTRFRPNGARLQGYVDKSVVLSRAALRKEEINPHASIGEKWSAEKMNKG